MGCDGIWETKTSEKMVKWIKKKLDSQKDNSSKVLESLFKQQLAFNSYDQFGVDNMTAILIEIKWFSFIYSYPSQCIL